MADHLCIGQNAETYELAGDLAPECIAWHQNECAAEATIYERCKHRLSLASTSWKDDGRWFEVHSDRKVG